MGLSLDDFNDMDDKLPTLKKNIQSQHINVIETYTEILNKQCETLQFDDSTLNMLKLCKDFKYTPLGDDVFKKLVTEFLKQTGNYEADLNWIDTSHVQMFNYLFYKSPFNGDISNWDISNAITMVAMFRESNFDGDINKWDVSSVKYMSSMFYKSPFKGDISN